MPYHVSIRFYEELNDFLPRDKQRATYQVDFPQPRSIKDLVEAEGVPHTEVDLILVNGAPVDFEYLVADGDRISVYPVFESLDIQGVSPLRPRPLREPRFIADVHLGKLSRLLRLLGLDCRYEPALDDPELAAISHAERRILLTRDHGLLKRRIVDHGICIRSDDPEEQAREVIRRIHLEGSLNPATRCPACNGLLEDVAPEAVAGLVPADTWEAYDAFRRCRQCAKIYWKGTHWKRLQPLIDELTANHSPAPRDEA